jgi:histidine decarboxylase
MQRNRMELSDTKAPPLRGHDDVLRREAARMRAARENHLGYPYNLAFAPHGLERFSGYLVNNLGDPYAGSHYGTDVCALERQVVSWFERLWECDGDAFWGSVGASGTEGNLWAIYLGREALGDPVLVHAEAAHYSIPKAARILKMEACSVRCLRDGAILLPDLDKVLHGLGSRPVVLALTCGTTMKGAHDDIAGAIAAANRAGYGPERRFVHVDGALNAMVLPFAEDAPPSIRPSFRQGIDSLSTSGHKMVGTPMPCGVLLTRRRHVERVAAAISYLRSDDTTLMGSRNGHAVLAIWNRLTTHGTAGFRSDVAACLSRAERLASELMRLEVPVLRNPLSLTVVFPAPLTEIVRKYQLPCDRGQAHAIVMPNVGDELIDRFLQDYGRWWRGAGETEEVRRLLEVISTWLDGARQSTPGRSQPPRLHSPKSQTTDGCIP